MRVQIELGPQPGWVTNRAIKSPHQILCIILDFQKMLFWSMFHVKRLNKLLTACILNWGPCFCMVWFIRDSSFV